MGTNKKNICCGDTYKNLLCVILITTKQPTLTITDTQTTKNL